MANTSAIEAGLMKATGLKPKKGENDQDWFERLVKDCQALGKDDWDALTPKEQKWVNASARAYNDDKAIPDFPDRDDDAKGDTDRKDDRSAKGRDDDRKDDEKDERSTRGRDRDDGAGREAGPQGRRDDRKDDRDDREERSSRRGRDDDRDDDRRPSASRSRSRDDDDDRGSRRRSRGEDDDRGERRRPRDDEGDDRSRQSRSRDDKEGDKDVARAAKDKDKAKNGRGAAAKDKDDKGPRKERGGAQSAIKTMIIKNPAISVEKIMSSLETKKLDATESSVASIRAGTLQTLRLVKEFGMPKGEI